MATNSEYCVKEVNERIWDDIFSSRFNDLESTIRSLKIGRQIGRAAFTNDKLKEMHSIFAIRLEMCAKTIKDLMKMISMRYGIKEDNYEKLILGVIEQRRRIVRRQCDPKNEDRDKYGTNHFTDESLFGGIVAATTGDIHAIDIMIQSLVSTMRCANNNDTRLNAATTESIIKSFSRDDFNHPLSSIPDGSGDETIKHSNDPFSDENVKVIIEKLRIFKRSIISSFNKYFGKNSCFGNLNLIGNLIY